MKAEQYRKKPVVIEAVELTIDGDTTFDEITEWCNGVAYTPDLLKNVGIDIKTLEGTMRANLGDYIIKGVKGEFYPCKPDIFEATYEPVKESK